jgi:hypothetical protein
MKTKQKVKKAAVDRGKKGMIPPRGGNRRTGWSQGTGAYEQRRKAVRLYSLQPRHL